MDVNASLTSDSSSWNFTKHFDPSKGQYYFYDHVSNSSTWDKPAGGEIAVYRSEEQLQEIRHAQVKAATKRSQLNERRKGVFEEFHRERAEEVKVERDEAEAAEKNRLHGFWKAAALEASRQNGQLELSWNKDLTVIDPSVYDFQENFGIHLRSLRLVGLSLTALPDDFCLRLASLDSLSLANNQITVLPDNFVLLTNLRVLNLLNNGLTALPSRIGLLCALKNLEIANNRIETLPITFAALNMLVKVNFECNKLKSLPENLDNLTSCKYFNVNNNKLQRLPRCLAKMPSLITLSACKNMISYIPQELSDSKTLRVIRLSANKIRFIPDNIGDIKKLKELSMDFNVLSKLPLTIHKLHYLKVLRVEGNPSLNDPPPEIIAKGAEGVVAYFRDRVKNDEEGRIRNIVISVQDCLHQVNEKNLSDPSEYEANCILEDDADPWFAFQMPYFWSVLMPALRECWRIEGLQGIIDMKYKVSFFPYTEKDVVWALGKFSDAYGPIVKKRTAFFRKCSCTENGVRKPCVPPKVGYMCKRTCTMIKMQLVFQADRQERLWVEYKKNNLADALKRAKNEAETYLTSKEGKEWLAQEAFEQANIQLLQEDGDGKKKGWRLRLASKRKKRIIKKYDKRILKTKQERDFHSQLLQKELATFKEILSADNMVPGTFIYIQTEAKAQNIVMRLGAMEEDVRLQRLLLLCEEECDKVDDFLYEQGDEYSSEEEDVLSDTSDEADSDDSQDYAKQQKKEAVRRMKEEVADRALVRAKAAKDIRDSAFRARSYLPYNSEDKTLVPAPSTSLLSTATQIFTTIATETLEKARAAMDDETEEIDSEEERVKKAEVERIKHIKKANMRHLRKKFRRVKDVMEARMKRIVRSTTGSAVELIRELTHEYKQQYLKISVADAKEKAEKDLFIIDNVRSNMSGGGVKKVFEAWKLWVKDKYERAKRDEETRFIAEMKTFSTAMTSVFIAEHQLHYWKKCVDIFTDEVYWQHEQTKEISLEEPSLRHYLPEEFIIPAPPKKHLVLEKLKVENLDGLIEPNNFRELSMEDMGSHLAEMESNVAIVTSPLTDNTTATPPLKVQFSRGDILTDTNEDDESDYDDDEMADDYNDEYDEFGYLDQVDEDSDGEHSSTAFYKPSSMAMLPSYSARSMVHLAGSTYGMGRMGSKGAFPSTDAGGSKRTLIGRRLNKSGVGFELIGKDGEEQKEHGGRRSRRGSLRSRSGSLEEKISGVTPSTRANRRSMRRSRLAMKESLQALMALEAATPPVIDPDSSNVVPLLTPSQLSYSLLRAVRGVGDSDSVIGAGSVGLAGSLDPPSDMAVIYSQMSVSSPLRGEREPCIPMASIPLSGIKGRIARALLKNTQAGDALVTQFGGLTSPTRVLPISSYGTPGRKNIPVASASQLQKRYEEAKSYLEKNEKNEKKEKNDQIEAARDGSSQFLPNIEKLNLSEDAQELAEAKSVKEKFDAEYFLAAKAVRAVRDQSEIARRGTYLPKVPTGKSRTLEAIAAARLEVTAEEEKKNNKKRIEKDAENKMNPYNYDLNNLKVASGGTLPTEHLLILSAEGKDTKNIVLSDTKNFQNRTELAYKAIRINDRLTKLAEEKGLIERKPQKSFYDREIAPIFHKKMESSESSSDDEALNKKGTAGQAKILRKMQEKDALRKGERRGKVDKAAKLEDKLLHNARKKLKSDIRQQEIDKKEAFDAKLVAKITSTDFRKEHSFRQDA